MSSSFIHPLQTPDYSYATLLITNQDKDIMLANGSLNTNIPILNNPNEYVGRLQRVSLACDGVPLIIPKIVLGQNDANLLVYKFALVKGTENQLLPNIGTPANVVFTPQSDAFPVPSAGLPPIDKFLAQDLSTGYYYVYSYSAFLQMWNTAINEAVDNYQEHYDDLPDDFVNPEFYYDPSCGIVLKAQTKYFNKNSDADFPPNNKFTLACNGSLIPLVNGIKTNYITFDINTPYLFNFYDEVINYDSTNDYYLQKQQSINDLCYWSSITSFQIITTMPIVYENIQGSQGTQSKGTQPSQYSNVLTDIVIDTSLSPSAYKTLSIYNNNDFFRVFNFTKSTPINNLNATIQWVDQYGRTYPLYLTYGTSCSIKFEFIKKSVFYTH